MKKKGTLTELLSKSLEEAKKLEKGPNTRELETVFSTVARDVFGVQKFEWNGENWGRWISLARGQEVLGERMVQLNADGGEGDFRYSINIGGPESKSARWSISCNGGVDTRKLYECLAANYELSEENKHVPTEDEVKQALEEWKNEGKGPYPQV
jgi:hypothetical protein